MTDAKLLEAVISAPAERREAILAAARGAHRRTKPITAKAAAERLGVCSRSVFRYAERGLLRPIRLSPRMIRFDAEEVEELLDGRGGPMRMR